MLKPRLCGRTRHGVYRSANGERVDNGQHALFGCYHETFALLSALALPIAFRVQGALAVILSIGPAGAAVCGCRRCRRRWAFSPDVDWTPRLARPDGRHAAAGLSVRHAKNKG